MARRALPLLCLTLALASCSAGVAPKSPSRNARQPASGAGQPTAQEARAPAQPPDFDRQVMVILPPGPERQWARVTYDLGNVYGLKPVFAWTMKSLGEQCVVYEVPKDRSREEISKLLSADRRVGSVQPVESFRVLGGSFNDPYAHLQYAAETLHLAEAHAMATGKGVKVAVVDTGVDFSHPDLEGQVVKARNFVSWGEPAFTGDRHGTALAGVIGAGTNNQRGIVGVAPDAQLIAIKACWQDQPGARTAECNSYTLALALDFALLEGAKVINLSLTGPQDPLLARLLGKAVESGITVVAAAAETGGGEGFPASVDGVLAVQAADQEGQLRAPPATGSGKPLLAAPGVDILTTAPHAAYDFFTGSSVAAAQVSGVASLLLERRPELKPAEIRALLAESAHPAGPGKGNPEPAGLLVDACAALARLLGSGTCP